MYNKAKKVLFLLIIHTFLIAVALSCIFPFIWMINSSFKTNPEFINDYGLRLPEEIRWENYAFAFKEGKLGLYFLQ